MAFDSAAKRWSFMHITMPFYISTPIPDGAVDQGDRQEFIHVYRGILLAGLPIAPFEIEFDISVPGFGFSVKRPAVSIDVARPEVNLVVK